jgi:hypothetical protein
MWLKNTAGTPDSMLTFAVGGFFTVIGSIACSILAGSKFIFAGHEIVLSSPDPTLVTAFLGATLLAYVNRRNKKDDLAHELKKAKIEKGADDV